MVDFSVESVGDAYLAVAGVGISEKREQHVERVAITARNLTSPLYGESIQSVADRLPVTADPDRCRRSNFRSNRKWTTPHGPKAYKCALTMFGNTLTGIRGSCYQGKSMQLTLTFSNTI
ncbi:uncharacterized protein LOC127850058 isoform X4 [Dreissena polymorpha]|uniref:uncharacterized protein LOC127850058 isoform X4 n=1 Tax=Dreissena polymorpha TaxID=45954 RepID=UPI0022645CE6|nr:uncharacterized protein LOC127850058 isoform X4 [Dreissena polymorpha]